MSSIRKTKKAMKNSSGFFTIRLKNFYFANNLCFNESDIIIYHKHSIDKIVPELGPFKVAYNNIKRLIIEKSATE